MSIAIYLLIFSINFSALASFEKKEAGAREQALGNALVAFQDHPFAIHYNPANIISRDTTKIFAGYRNFFDLAGIYQADIVANTSLLNKPISFAVSKYGNDLYSEIQISFGSSISVFENFAVGGSLQLYSLSIKNYGESLACGINLGVKYKALENVYLGAHITNINSPTIGKVAEEIPRTFSLGAQYELFDRGIILFELHRDVQHEQDYRSGFEYEVFDRTFLRLGISDKSNIYSFGVGSEINIFVFDYALMVHEILGASHALSVGVKL
ncbi:hypothetical protein ACFLSX_00605 [Calditrichota bacterium]